jgi:uncharacterized protein YbaR (Trm112 family)
MDQRLLDILACPVCKGRLKYLRESGELLCRADRLVYPIHDGIPWLLEEEARQVASDDPVLEHG